MAINKVIGSIPYSVGLRAVNPGNAESEKKAFAYVQSREVVTNKLLAQHIKEHGSPFSVGTLHGVIDDVCECVGEMLLMGNRVQLDGLGTIYVTLASEGADDAESFTASCITAVHPRMAFAPAFEAALQHAEFEYTTSRKAQAESKKAEKEALNQALTGNGTGSDTGGNGSGGGDVTE